MEVLRSLLWEMGTLSFVAAVLIAFLYAIKVAVSKLTRRWANKRLRLYRQSGLKIYLSSHAVDSFAGSIAMFCYGAIIASFGIAFLVFGYQLKDHGFHPDITALWIVSAVPICIGTMWMMLTGSSAYGKWRKSFLPLHSEYLRITANSAPPFTMR